MVIFRRLLNHAIPYTNVSINITKILKITPRNNNTCSQYFVRSFAVHSSVLERAKLFEKRYETINNELSSNMNLSPNEITQLSIELGEIEPAIEVIKQMNEKKQELKDLEEIIDEPVGSNASTEDLELREIAQDEHAETRALVEELEATLTRLMLPRDKEDEKNAIVEIRAGTGGDEAALFANDMLRMYQKYAIAKGWKFEIMSLSETDLGGCKEATLSFAGRGAYGRLKYESGVHRVQRVPVNDVRVHTSTTTVAVLSAIEEVDTQLNPSDLRIDTYRASGAGGQHVNTTESAVRITHIPTGIVAAVQDERSQHKNKAKAMKILAARVHDAELSRIRSKRDSIRNKLIGTGDRSERVRTYNFPQSRISDHRVNMTVYGMERMLSGDLLDEMIDALVLHDQNVLLENMIEDNKS